MLLPLFLSFVALALLRVFESRLLGIGPGEAYRTGILAGFFADLAVAFLPLALGWVASAAWDRLRKPIIAASTLLIWSITAVGACYSAFFRSRFDLWIADGYFENAWSVRGMGIRYVADPILLGSLFLCLLLAAITLRKPRDGEETRSVPRLTRLGAGAAAIALALLAHQIPTWFRFPRIRESPLADQIVFTWYNDAIDGRWATRLPVAQYRKILPSAQGLLQTYRQLDKNTPWREAAGPAARALASRKLRAMLGLPQGRPLNVVILFLESGRAFELLNPVPGDEVFPELKRVFREHGILFRQAYSTAEITVQGQFTTLCSDMDRVDAAPVYMRQPYLRRECLPEVFAQAGYETYWMNPFHRYFSGKYLFESHHGTRHFLDRDDFSARNDAELVNSTEWGVSDEVFLSRAMDALEKIHGEGKPFFAHLLTTGTHPPWHFFDGYSLSPELARATAGSRDYQAYLTSEKTLDHALGEFFARFFASPVSDDTVIVVSGDHGTGVVPSNRKLTPLQRNLLWPRIILGVVSKNIWTPHEVAYPIHQMDIAPLLAALAGLPTPASWLGREPLLSGGGTPWIKRKDGRFFYRTPDRICAEFHVAAGTRCWKLGPDDDPLLHPPTDPIAEDPAQSTLYRGIIDANEAALELSGDSAP